MKLTFSLQRTYWTMCQMICDDEYCDEYDSFRSESSKVLILITSETSFETRIIVEPKNIMLVTETSMHLSIGVLRPILLHKNGL
jgi:hypothetical protein